MYSYAGACCSSAAADAPCVWCSSRRPRSDPGPTPQHTRNRVVEPTLHSMMIQKPPLRSTLDGHDRPPLRQTSARIERPDLSGGGADTRSSSDDECPLAEGVTGNHSASLPFLNAPPQSLHACTTGIRTASDPRFGPQVDGLGLGGAVIRARRPAPALNEASGVGSAGRVEEEWNDSASHARTLGLGLRRTDFGARRHAIKGQPARPIGRAAEASKP